MTAEHMANEVSQRLELLLPTERVMREMIEGRRPTLARTGVRLTPTKELREAVDARWRTWFEAFEQRPSVAQLQEIAAPAD